MKRFKLAVISLHLFWAVAIAQAGSVTVESLTFALDTRRPLVGGVSGRIVSEGNPVGGALVEIEGTVHSATSGVDGVFAIADIPVGGGYNLMASAEEMLPKVVTGLTITGATTTAKSINAGTIRAAGNQNLGDISLQSARRPFKLVRLAPDVNVVNSDKKMTVEEGGCGHRYYQVLDANNKPVGNAVVTVRVKDGATIPQGDVLDEAAGRISGQSDPSGIIRFSVPGTYLTMGIYKEILLLGSGKQIAQFSAKLVPRRYDRVWKHKVGGGVSGKIKVVRVGGNAAFESEIVQTVEGSSAMQEEITRRRAVEAKAGVELSLPCKIVHV